MGSAISEATTSGGGTLASALAGVFGQVPVCSATCSAAYSVAVLLAALAVVVAGCNWA
ncbi:hypothetical protein P4M26_34750 [Pseudomonas aeruginosa]|nr:hypothetical protein [Pseudomonas aeruginosa]